MTKGHESRICNSTPTHTDGDEPPRGSGQHDMHMRGVGRVSPVDQSLVRLVSDPQSDGPGFAVLIAASPKIMHRVSD